MLFFSASEKLAPPASPGDPTGALATSPMRPTLAKLFTASIMTMPATATTHSSWPWTLPSPSHSPHTRARPPAHSHIPRPDRYWDRRHTHPCWHRDDWADIPCGKGSYRLQPSPP